MNLRIFFLISFLFIILLPNFSAASQEIPMNFALPEKTPYFVGTPAQNINSDNFNTLILRIKSVKEGLARLFWTNEQNVNFYIYKSESFKNYYINIPTQNPNWIGYIPQIIVFPEFGTDGVEIKEAKITSGSFLTNILSGWQEFWGPRGRIIIGSTINTMQSSNIFGQSIFAYIYWIIGIFVFFTLLYYTNQRLFRKKEYPEILILTKTAEKTFILIACLWIILGTNDLYNNWLEVKTDLPLIGKSQTEKLGIINTGDFYSFIEFCEKEIPIESFFDMRIPPIYNDIKARYYLYPRQNQKGARHLIVYDMVPEKEVFDKYAILKEFRPGAYIMIKKS